MNWGGTDATGARYGAAPNTQVTSARLKVLTCPSDTNNTPIGTMTNNNYVVNIGNTGNAQQATLNGITFGGAPFRNNGKTTAVNQIFDGTSNTLMMAEVIQGQGSDLRGFIWWGDAAGFTTYLTPNSTSPDVIYTTGYCNSNQPNPPCIGTPTTTAPAMMGARSRHTGGLNVLRCDGSCSFISNTINATSWQALGTAFGGEPITN